MADSHGEYCFYAGSLGEKEREIQFGISKQQSEQDRGDSEKNQAERKPNEISFFGIKMSYAKAFGIAFLVIFLLLFFPGIGVSSSTVKSKQQDLITKSQEGGSLDV
jgi:hypothetical protein